MNHTEYMAVVKRTFTIVGMFILLNSLLVLVNSFIRVCVCVQTLLQFLGVQGESLREMVNPLTRIPVY